ncbi:MAG: hypothetical protein JRG81_00075 [Deltaproteobacteria bacterium]|nr:hypothetical protein [Deltaproteobacteria bacterium]MBW2363473.1 hypothetical protein [Deltaproteobacteria bacterium]
MYDQIGAVTGLRRRSSAEDIINAQTPYLPARVQAKKDKEFAEKAFIASEAQADRDFALGEKQLAIDDETAHDARKHQNRANNLGYANLGLNILSETGAMGDIYDAIMDFF